MVEVNDHVNDHAEEEGGRTTQLYLRDMSQTLQLRRTPRANPNAVSEVLDTVYRRINDDDAGELQSRSMDLSGTKTSQEKKKLILILVGLPGRGKTYLCNKLTCYLNWMGHVTRHFNVGAYRRKIKNTNCGEIQDANFFDHTNEAGMRVRQQALEMALSALMDWLSEADEHQVAIFDATNTTVARRDYLINRFHGKQRYIFIESVCNDEETLEKNIALKLKYSPDYAGMDYAQALADFKARISEYEKVYVPVHCGTGGRQVHFIQLNNMVTGRGYMDINRISGYLPGKIVFFLMQVCRSGLNSNRRIWLTRHGESEFNQGGLIGGDAPLTEKGRAYSRALAAALCRLVPVPDSEEEELPVSCWTSTLRRTIQTAKHVPFPTLRWKALDEIHAGICDGHTYAGIKEKWPETYAARKKDKLNFRYPAGESYMDVVKRVESVIVEVERESESVCIVGHQAILRVLYSYFMQVNRHEMPELEMPLHTLIELEPRPDGTMVERRYRINIDSTSDDTLYEMVDRAASPQSPGSQAAPPFHTGGDSASVRAARETAEATASASTTAKTRLATSVSMAKRNVAFVPAARDGDGGGDSVVQALSRSLRQASIASCASPCDWESPGMESRTASVREDDGASRLQSVSPSLSLPANNGCSPRAPSAGRPTCDSGGNGAQ